MIPEPKILRGNEYDLPALLAQQTEDHWEAFNRGCAEYIEKTKAYGDAQ